MGKNGWYSCAFLTRILGHSQGHQVNCWNPQIKAIYLLISILKKDCLLWTQPANYPFVSFQKVNKLVIKVISVSDLDVRKEANGSTPKKWSFETEMSLRKMVFEG